MNIYLPKIIANSPSELPQLEKILFYYILDHSFRAQYEKSNTTDLEINLTELVSLLSDSSIEFVDLKSQVKQGISNLTKIKLSLVDNGFHIKLSPIENTFTLSSTLYVTLNPIIVDYLDQILDGDYINYNLLSKPISPPTQK